MEIKKLNNEDLEKVTGGYADDRFWEMLNTNDLEGDEDFIPVEEILRRLS